MAALEIYRGSIGMARGEEEIARRLGGTLTEELGRSHPRTATEMLAAEQARRSAGGAVADLLIARDILRAHQDRALVGEATAECRDRLKTETGVRHVKNVGLKRVSVRLPHGLEVRMPTPYLRPTQKGMRGRPRGHGKRREGGAGAYPVLERLGVADHVTPLTRSDAARQTVVCSSNAEAREQLSAGGLELDKKTLARIAVSTGVDAIAHRDAALERARVDPLPDRSPVAGKRIRVSLDGGRARTRQTRRGSRKGANGRRPFDLAWREPRIITIDVLDEEGHLDREWRPIYEVSLGTADEVFVLLTGLLRLIGAHLASEVVFVADGALWIWDRVDQLIRDAGVSVDRVHKVLDYYHATEHIADALRACKNLSEKRRKALREELCRELLEPGGPERVLDRLRNLAVGRRGKKVNSEVRYLERRLDQMAYASLRQQKLPVGSGIVESAVRRVLNLRFKSASICWRPDHLEALLYLRAIVKSGRWDDFMQARLDGQHWLRPQAQRADARIVRREAA